MNSETQVDTTDRVNLQNPENKSEVEKRKEDQLEKQLEKYEIQEPEYDHEVYAAAQFCSRTSELSRSN